MTDLGNSDKQEIGRWANDPVENSHLSFRRRERAMLRFRRMLCLQNFALVHANVHNHFHSAPPRRQTHLQAAPLGSTSRLAIPVQLILTIKDTGAPIRGKCALV